MKIGEPPMSTGKVKLGQSRRGPAMTGRVGLVKLREASLRPESHLYQARETQILCSHSGRLANDTKGIVGH